MDNKKSILLQARNRLSAPFLSAALILIAGAAGLRPAMTALSVRFLKQSIPIRKPLAQFDISRLPSFSTGWLTSNVPPEDIETDEFAIIHFSRRTFGTEPKEVVLFVTYYSDPQSNVPHTPDVCYRQGGAVVKKMSNITIDPPESAPCPKIKARLLLMRRQKLNQAIIFCFYVDGRFRHSREQVRWMIRKPGNRYVYFSKIETVAMYPLNGEPTEAIELCKRLFAEAVGQLISEHFPTREQLRP